MTYINPYMLFTGSMIPNWLMRRNEISAGAKLTYARLCQYAGENGVAWPSVTTLAAEVGLKERQVQYILAELEKAKLIERKQVDFSKPNEIRFLHSEWMEGCRTLHGGGAVYDTTGVQNIAHEENQGRESYKPKKEARQSRLSDEWEPQQSDFDWANEKHPTVDAILETTKFKNYHMAKGSQMVNWSRAWMTWIINAEQFNGKRRSPAPTGSARPAYDRESNMQRIFDAASAFERNRSGQ